MPELQPILVDLVVQHADADPAEVTSVLGVSPFHAIRLGEVGNWDYPVPLSTWLYQAELTGSISSAIQQLLDGPLRDGSKIRELSLNAWEIRLSITTACPTDHDGLFMSAPQMLRMGELGIDCELWIIGR